MQSVNCILEKVGNTPHISIPSFFDKNKKLILKLENKNPSGTIKDRLAKMIINNNLNQDIFVIDSGIWDFAVSLSWFTSFLGKKTIIIIRDDTDIKFIDRVHRYGASIIFSNVKKQEDLNIIAKEYAMKHNYFYCGYPNGIEYQDNIAKEIYKEISNLNFNSLVSYYGSGATIDALRKIVPKKIPIIMASLDIREKVADREGLKYYDTNEIEVQEVQNYLLQKCAIPAGILGATSATIAMKLLEENIIENPLVLMSDTQM